MLDYLEELLEQMADEGQEDASGPMELAGWDVLAVPPAQGAGVVTVAGRFQSRELSGSEPEGDGQDSLPDKDTAGDTAQAAQDAVWTAFDIERLARRMGDDADWGADREGAEQLPEWLTGRPVGRVPDGILEMARDSPADAAAGLEKLYRRTAQAARPTVLEPVDGGAAREPWTGAPAASASLTVEELDRAVRRDSRRYDGEMKLY